MCESKGTKIARELRRECNRLSRRERDELMEAGMAMIYGATLQADKTRAITCEAERLAVEFRKEQLLSIKTRTGDEEKELQEVTDLLTKQQ